MIEGLPLIRNDGMPALKKIRESKEMDEVTKRAMFDGCFTGYNARGNSFYKTALYFRLDPKMIHDDKYSFAWARGYVACFPEANGWTYMGIGGKFINTDHLGKWISPVGQGVVAPLGGDAESKPAVWYFDESIDRGIPGVANYGGQSSGNLYGVFGSCYLC